MGEHYHFLALTNPAEGGTTYQTLWLLANNISAQEKLRQECSALIADHPRPDYRSLKDLQYLDCVMCVDILFCPFSYH